LLRGYGVQFWIFLQDIDQLKGLYKNNWNSFIANSGIRQLFNLNDPVSARYFSKFLGQTTVFVQSDGENFSEDHIGMQDHAGRSRSYREHGRPLMTKNELYTMSDDQQIIIQSGHAPIKNKKIFYYKDPAFKDLAPTRQQVRQRRRAASKTINLKPTRDIQRKIKNIIASPSWNEKGPDASHPAGRPGQSLPDDDEPNGLSLDDWE